MSDFNEAPKKKKTAVLNWSNSTYSSLNDVDGKQPYYTYQYIGSLTGGTRGIGQLVFINENNSQYLTLL